MATKRTSAKVSRTKRVVLKKRTAAGKKAKFTKASAKRAVRKAKKAYAGSKAPASWQPGGKEWSRVLGHFGAA
jgi:hypothetical protein